MSHDYAGNPSNYPSAVTLGDDGVDDPDFVTFNTGYEGALDRNAWNKSHAGIGPLISWQLPLTWTLGLGPYAVAFYDQPLWQDWIVLEYGNVTGHWGAYHGPGDGTWTQIGTDVSTGTPPGCVVAASDGSIWVSNFVSGTIITWRSPGYGSNFNAGASNTVTACTDYRMVAVGSGIGLSIVGAIGSSTSGQAQLGIVSNIGFTSSLASLTTQGWVLKSNGSNVIAIPVGVSSPLAYQSADGGETWTSASIGSGTELIIDLCWDAARAQWVLGTIPGGGVSKFYASPDGATWSPLGTIGGSSEVVSISALACVNGNYFTLYANGTNFNLAASYDGIKWTTVPVTIYAGTANLPGLVASPSQLVGAPLLKPSTGSPTNVRFSGLACLGGAIL